MLAGSDHPNRTNHPGCLRSIVDEVNCIALAILIRNPSLTICLRGGRPQRPHKQGRVHRAETESIGEDSRFVPALAMRGTQAVVLHFPWIDDGLIAIGEFHSRVALASASQDFHALLERRVRPNLEFVQRPAADRMVHHRERVVRQAERPGDVLARRLERVGADHECGFAELFEGDAVMHTAR